MQMSFSETSFQLQDRRLENVLNFFDQKLLIWNVASVGSNSIEEVIFISQAEGHIYLYLHQTTVLVLSR